MVSLGLNSPLSLADQLHLIEKLQLFKIQDRDKLGRKVLRIVGKFFPAQFVSKEALKKYLKENILPELGEKPFSVVYFHTDVQNFAGISNFGIICDLIPSDIKDNVEALYFVHPDVQARLVLSAFGLLIFGGGLYKKTTYVSSVEYLWDHVKIDFEIPEFVKHHDGEFEYRSLLDYGSGFARIYYY